jgi:hypothetical protein
MVQFTLKLEIIRTIVISDTHDLVLQNPKGPKLSNGAFPN